MLHGVVSRRRRNVALIYEDGRLYLRCSTVLVLTSGAAVGDIIVSNVPAYDQRDRRASPCHTMLMRQRNGALI